MSTPDPILLHAAGEDEAFAAELLAATRAETEWSGAERAAVLRAMRARERRRARRRSALAAGFACALVGAGAYLVAHRPAAPEPARIDEPPRAAALNGAATDAARASATRPRSAERWTVLDVAELGTIEVSGDEATSVDETADERRIRLDHGLLRAHIAHQDPFRPVVVVTPHVRVVVVGTRFDVRVEPARTRIAVLEGRVHVESPTAVVAVSGGEAIVSDDPRLGPAAPLEPATGAVRRVEPPQPARVRPSSLACGELERSEDRERCLRRLARGADLAAENALYTLGLAAQTGARPGEALEHWRQYQQRFPRGVLSPEVAIGIFEVLLAEGRVPEAIGAAADYEERFPEDPRATGVSLARAKLLCGDLQARPRGRALLERLTRSADRRTRAEATLALTWCTAGPGGAAERAPEPDPGAPERAAPSD